MALTSLPGRPAALPEIASTFWSPMRGVSKAATIEETTVDRLFANNNVPAIRLTLLDVQVRHVWSIANFACLVESFGSMRSLMMRR